MLAVNYSTFRNHLKNYLDQVTDDHETVIVTRKNEKNIVTMSLEQYNNLMENLFILSNKTNYKHILEGIHQLENGNYTVKNDTELENLINE